MTVDLISISDNQQEQPQKICRVCRDDEGEEPLFSPCHCKSFIHQQCLVDWLKSKNGVQDSSDINYDAHCEICLGKIHFKREYTTTSANVGFVKIIKLKWHTVLQYLNCTKYVVFLLNFLWFLVNWFVIRKYFVTKQLPRWEPSYVFENNSFFVDDLTIASQQLLFGASVLTVLWSNKMGARLVNHHFGKPIDTEIPIPKIGITFKLNFCLFLAAPLLVPLCLLVFGAVPIYFTKLFFRTNHFSKFSNHIFGSLMICLLASIVPVQTFSKSNERLFTVLFYTKYYAKLAAIQYIQFLSFAMVLKPAIDRVFGDLLFGVDAHPIPISDLSLKALFMSPYSSFAFLVLNIMQFFNASFFRPGAFYFFPKFGDESSTDDSIYLFGIFWHLWSTFEDVLSMIAVFFLLYGASLRLLVDFKPDLFPISLGFFLPKNQNTGGSTVGDNNSFVFTNLDKLLVILGPLLAKFSDFYFKPFAKLAARKLRLTSYLFGQGYIDERGYVVYRNWKQQLFNPTMAALSNSTLYSDPQTKTELCTNFERNALVNAYFVPNGNFARVPGFLPMDYTERYFVPVTRKDKLLGDEPEKLVSDYKQLRNIKTYNYDVVYIPPLFKLRLFFFYIVMGSICNMTFLYFTISSNYLGKQVLKLLQFAPHIYQYIDSTTCFTLTNVVLGLFLQLTLINSLCEKKIPKYVFENVLKAIMYPVMLYVFIKVLTVFVFAFSGCISYNFVCAYDLFYKSFIRGEKRIMNVDHFYFIFPRYLFDEYMFHAFLPVLLSTSVITFKFFIQVANENRPKTVMKNFWNVVVKPTLYLFTRYFGISLVVQVFYVLLKNFKAIKSFADVQAYMGAMFSVQMHSWGNGAFLLIGPAVFSFEATRDFWKTCSNYWAKSKHQAMDKLNAEKIFLQDAE
ncbi:ERAD-associated E3 ubiquitin-protein ligase DOA10 [Hanseniaspora osmophila]|uniref:RING-type E3 ubiquitin transferase n=1 Tax=Hanseniaspora osmophila TaxID=56408 RepID=A0A1E5R8E9_9ASCO|nr:ERAD-associated E3 ubiquitin-protein ligase DOA10 [Hanseniaspora osmophila]